MTLHQLKHCIQLWSSMNIYPSPPKLIVYHNTTFFFFNFTKIMPEFPTEESKTDDYVRRTSIASDFSMTTKNNFQKDLVTVYLKH